MIRSKMNNHGGTAPMGSLTPTRPNMTPAQTSGTAPSVKLTSNSLANVRDSRRKTATSCKERSVSQSNHSNLIAQTYQIGRKIGSGNFGDLFLGKNAFNSDLVAIKLESSNSVFLRIEYKIYRRLLPYEGIPNAFYYGQCNGGRQNALVLELLGENLEELFNYCNRKFSLKTVCMIGIQLIQRVEYLHSKNIIYRDIKPENFLIGRMAQNKHRTIHMIDFGLAKEFINSQTGAHIPFVRNKSLTGTARYMSVNTHLGLEQSRRDDLEAVGHMLVYFLRGSLPWQGLKADSVEDRYKKIGETKQQTKISELCAKFPEEFARFMTYVRGLEFSEKPEYKKLVRMFEDLAKAKGWSPIDWEFDWVEKKSNELKAKNESTIVVPRSSVVQNSCHCQGSQKRPQSSSVLHQHNSTGNSTRRNFTNVSRI